jgi:hypothetical protein
VVGYRRVADGAAPVTVLISMSDQPVSVDDVPGTLLIDSLGELAPGAGFDGKLAARQAVVVQTEP